TDTDNPYLKYLQADRRGVEPAKVDSDRRIRAADHKIRNLLRAHLADSTSKDEKLKKLLDLRDKVLQLRVVFVEVDNEDDATIIFQTLNSRGRDLEVSDLVKSHIMAAIGAPNPDYDPPREKWNSILESFE